MKKTRLAITAVLAALLLTGATASAQVQMPLPPNRIPQFAQPLPLLGATGVPFTLGRAAGGGQFVDIKLCEFQTQVLPTGTIRKGVAPLTWVWGYQEGTGPCNPLPGHSYLGPVVLAKRNVPTQMTFTNLLPDATVSMVQAYKKSTDQTLIWGDPLSLNTTPPPINLLGTPNPVTGLPYNSELNLCYEAAKIPLLPVPCADNYGFTAGLPWAPPLVAPIPAAVHIHGGEVPATIDGGPDSWWTPNGIYGHGYYTRNVKTLPLFMTALPALPATIAGLPAMPATVAPLPVLPDLMYPVGTLVFEPVTATYFVNAVDPLTLLETWTATTVTYPLGTMVFDSTPTTGGYFQNALNVWTAVAAPYAADTLVQIPTIDPLTLLVSGAQVYEFIANAWVASPIIPFAAGTLVQNQADASYQKATTTTPLSPWENLSWVTAAIDRASYVYPNGQEAAPIWFHDHILGATRLNVYAGIAGGFMVTDDQLSSPNTLPPGLLPLGLDRNANNTLDLGTDEVLVPLIIQDRMFDTAGQLYFPAVGINPEHPYWIPEFVGNTIAVNGAVWPFMNVQAKRYRFLVLNGSNARAYELGFTNTSPIPPKPKKGQPPPPALVTPGIYVIGNDQGYLDAPIYINPAAVAPANKLVVMPGERYEIIVDFAGAAGQTLELRNTAATPYPAGIPVNPRFDGKVMKFVVAAAAGGDGSYDPALGGGLRFKLDPVTATKVADPIVRLASPTTGTVAPGVTISKVRRLTLNEVLTLLGPLEILVNNTLYDGNNPARVAAGLTDFTPVTSLWNTSQYSELPYEGETELWEIVNLTVDAHPMHPHLVAFQVLNRQAFDAVAYPAVYNASFPPGVKPDGFGPPLDYNCGNGAPGPGVITNCVFGGNPDPMAIGITGPVVPPSPQEIGWKDTFMALPGMVNRALVRFGKTAAPLAAPVGYDFNPGEGHGYVWHCHIIDHEDNEMMRPFQVLTDPLTPRNYVQGFNY